MIDISLNQLKTLLNYQSNGTFATSAAKTTGTLQLGVNGKLQNANRHWYSRNTKDAGAQQNFDLRQALVETFRKNNASVDFLNQVRDTLGLDKNSLSSGMADAKGVLESTRPLERRVVKQLITAFEQSRAGRDLSTDFEAVDKKALEARIKNDAAEEVELDPATQHMNRLAEASKTFMKELTDGLGDVKKVPDRRGGTMEFDVNDKLRKLQLQNIENCVNDLAQDVGSGKRTAFNALEKLAYVLYDSIGDQNIYDVDPSKVVADARFKVIHDALNNFAAAMGAEGTRPLLTVIKENIQTKLVNAFANFKTPLEDVKLQTVNDILTDFARTAYKAIRPLQTIFMRDQQVCGVKDQVSLMVLLEQIKDTCREKCQQQDTPFAEFLRFVNQKRKDVPQDDRKSYIDLNRFCLELSNNLFNEKAVLGVATSKYSKALNDSELFEKKVADGDADIDIAKIPDIREAHQKAIAKAKAELDKIEAEVNSADTKIWLADILCAVGLPELSFADIEEMEAYLQEQ